MGQHHTGIPKTIKFDPDAPGMSTRGTIGTWKESEITHPQMERLINHLGNGFGCVLFVGHFCDEHRVYKLFVVDVEGDFVGPLMLEALVCEAEDYVRILRHESFVEPEKKGEKALVITVLKPSTIIH